MAAGITYIELQPALDKLQKEINGVQKQFNRVSVMAGKTSTETSNKFTVMGKNFGKAIEGLNNTAVGGFAKMMTGMQKAIMAMPIVNVILMIAGAVAKLFSGIADWIKETSEAYTNHQMELAKIGSVLQSTGAIAWTSVRQLEDQAKSLSKETGHSVDEIMKMQSVLLGFQSITGEAFERTQKAVIDMAAVMGGDIVSAAQTLGKAIDNPVEGMSALSQQGFVFDQATKDLIKSLEEQGKHFEAQDIILKEVEERFGGTAKAMADVNAAQSKLTALTEELKIAQGEATSGISNWWTNVKIAWKESQLEAQLLRNAMDRLEKGDEGYSQQIKNIEMLKEGLKKLTDETEIANQKKLIVKAELELDQTKLDDKLLVAQGRLKQYAAMRGVSEEVLASHDEYYKELQKEIEALEWGVKATKESMDAINALAAEESRKQALIDADMAQITELEAKTKEIEQKRIQTIQEANAAREEGLINAEELAKITKQAYQDESNGIIQVRTALQGLSLQTIQGQEAVKNSIKQTNKGLKESVNNWKAISVASSPKKTSADMVNQREKYQADYKKMIAMQQEFANKEVQSQEETDKNIFAAKQQLYSQLKALAVEYGAKQDKNPETYRQMLDAAKEVREEVEAIANVKMGDQLEDWGYQMKLADGQLSITKMNTKELAELEHDRALKAITDIDKYKNASVPVQNAVKEKFEEVWKASHEKSPWESLKEGVEAYGGQVGQVLSAGLQMYADSVQRETDILLKALDERHQAQLEALEQEKQEKLFQMGFIEAATEEQYERELENAIRTGDELLIYQAERNLEKFTIEQEYEEQKKTLDEQYARDKAELEHKAALAQWQTQLTNTIVAAAQGLAQAIPNVPLMVLAGLTGAAQVAIVRANKPQLQTFSGGGIVAGSSMRGDNVLTRQNSREMDLNLRQQKNLFNRIDNDDLGGGSVTATIIVQMDSREIAQSTVNLVNNGQYTIKARSIA